MGGDQKKEKVIKAEEEWRKELSPEQFHIMRQCGTEPAFTGKYWKTKEKGKYLCAGCGNELFSSEAKYDSGTGWPSFWEPVSEQSVEMAPDMNLGVERIEVKCSRCGAHLGHVFDDGPTSPPEGYEGQGPTSLPGSYEGQGPTSPPEGYEGQGPTSPPEGYEGQGPQPTGKRFCINSAALNLRKKERGS